MSTSMRDPLPYPALGNTFGALFIGVIIAALLFGANNVQAFIYLQTDRSRGVTVYKLIVILLWILDAFHMALITHSVYHYLVINYANISGLSEIVWSFKLQVVIDFFVIYGIHVLYAHRIWIFSKGRSRVLPAIVGVILIVTSGVATVLTWEVYRSKTFTKLIALQWSAYMTLGVMAFNDLIIASSLCYLLSTSHTGISSTDSFLTKLVAYIINTGVLTSVTSIVAIIACAVMPQSFTTITVQFLMVKLYVSSFLALLNARYYSQPEYSDTISTSHIRFRHPSTRSIRELEAGKPLETRKTMSQRLCDRHDDLYPNGPDGAVMVISRITIGRTEQDDML